MQPTDSGIEYATYSAAVTYVEQLDETQIAALLQRLGGIRREGLDNRHLARAAVLHEFTDRTLSCRVMRSGKATLFDRCPETITIIEEVLSKIENETSGYAFVTDNERTQSLIWTAIALSRFSSTLEEPSDLWSVFRALDRDNEPYFDVPNADEVAEMLEIALTKANIEDQGKDMFRYCGDGFMDVEAYDAFIASEGPVRIAVSKAAETFFHKFRDACGPFNVAKSRETYLECGEAMYFDSKRVHSARVLRGLASNFVQKVKPAGQQEQVKAAMETLYPVSKGDTKARESFARRERDSGYSTFGYWFSPEGAVHAMQNYQDHEVWIRKELGVKKNLGRQEALNLGWVSMTMANDHTHDANIGYNPESGCSKALKSAASVLRRGGDFSRAVVETFDAEGETIAWQQYDELTSGVRHLNEMAREIASQSTSGPRR